MKATKVLLIGGQGLLGRSIQEVFLENQFINIYTLSRSFYQNPNHIQGSLLDSEKIASLTKHNFDFILNLSGQITNPIEECLNLNSIGVQKLIDLIQASPQTRLIQISTVGVYGSTIEANENSPMQPETPYSVAKCIAEKLIINSLDANSYTIIRLSNLYGEKQLKGVFAYLNKSANSNRELEFNNNGSLVRYFLHVFDCANIIVNIIQQNNSKGIFNIIGKDRFDIIELIKLYESIKHVNYQVKLAPIVPYDNALNISDNKIKSIIEYTHQINVESYLKKITSNDSNKGRIK
jgi:nucleoside-diphosphate-sugar epimerase